MKTIHLTPTPIPSPPRTGAVVPNPPPPTPVFPPGVPPLHVALLDPTRRYALAAYWPGLATPYYSWGSRAWTATRGPDGLLELAADPASWCGDLWVARLPAIPAGAAIVLQVLVLDEDGTPLKTVDARVLEP